MPEWEEYCLVRTPADPHDLDRALAKARLAVPSDLRELILRHQGQTPVPGTVALSHSGNTPFGPVLVVTPGPATPGDDDYSSTYTVAFALAALQEWRPSADGKPDFFPFASNTAAGWFCLDQRDAAQPVVFIATDLGAEDDGVFLVAASVTELLAMLKH